MRRLVPFVLISLGAAAPLSATIDAEPRDPAEEATALELERPAVVPAVASEAPQAPEVRLQTIEVEERVAADEAEAAQWPQRGSFWWLVAVVVVAGVILALVL